MKLKKKTLSCGGGGMIKVEISQHNERIEKLLEDFYEYIVSRKYSRVTAQNYRRFVRVCINAGCRNTNDISYKLSRYSYDFKIAAKVAFRKFEEFLNHVGISIEEVLSWRNS